MSTDLVPPPSQLKVLAPIQAHKRCSNRPILFLIYPPILPNFSLIFQVHKMCSNRKILFLIYPLILPFFLFFKFIKCAEIVHFVFKFDCFRTQFFSQYLSHIILFLSLSSSSSFPSSNLSLWFPLLFLFLTLLISFYSCLSLIPLVPSTSLVICHCWPRIA